MEWSLLRTMWPLLADLFYPPEPQSWPGSQPTTTDLLLTSTTYEFIAARTACGKCRAMLGRDLHLVVSGRGGDRAWRITVVTRCAGWRRHRHSALVTELCDGLRFGPLLANRPVDPGQPRSPIVQGGSEIPP